MLNPALDSAALARAFREARPFPHVIIDGLVDAELGQALLEEFPAFERAVRLDENGRAGDKAVFPHLSALGPAFGRLDQLLASAAFREFLTAVTGVPELLHDPDYVGGGTHQNQPGQELDPHVDFNLHPARPWLRRLNLLFYLNPGWQPEAGGELELYDDPWTSQEPAHKIAPLFNRCVIFETSDHSWHGFPAVRQVRRSVAAYYYVENQVADRPSHATIYVERGLPQHSTLEDFQRLLGRRRDHLARLRRREEEFVDELRDAVARSLSVEPRFTPAQLEAAHWLLLHYDEQLREIYQREPSWREAVRLFDPVAAALLPEPLRGRVEGLWVDGWAAPRVHLWLEARADLRRLTLRGWIHPSLGRSQQLTVQLDGGPLERRELPEGRFEWELAGAVEAGRTLELLISAEQSFRPGGDDGRELSWVLVGFSED